MWRKLHPCNFLHASFLQKLAKRFMPTNDAPSLALLVAKQCRNPGKPVENGLFVDFRDKMNGGACEITVQKEKFGVEIAVFLLFCR